MTTTPTTAYSYYRIGSSNRLTTTPTCTTVAIKSPTTEEESSVLRSLFELRRRSRQRAVTSDSDSDDETANNSNSVLAFRNCRWTPRILQSLRKLFEKDERRVASIRFVACRDDADNSDSSLFVDIIEMILTSNSTTSLVIEGNDENGTSNHNLKILETIRDGIQTNTSIVSLKLSNMPFQDVDDDDNDLWRNILVERETPLCRLDLSGSRLDRRSAEALSRALLLNSLASAAATSSSSLQSLSLARCALDDKSLSMIVGSVRDHPHLTNLNLSGNHISKSSSCDAAAPSTTNLAMEAIGSLLRSKTSQLQTLDLSQQRGVAEKPASQDEEQQQQDLASPSMSSSSLCQQRRTNNSSQAADGNERSVDTAGGGGKTAAFYEALAALSSNETLHRIDVSGNPGLCSDPDDVAAIGECLVANGGTLQEIDLSSCGLTAAGLKILAKQCVPLCRLKSLVLFDDDESNESQDQVEYEASLRALEAGLRNNTTIESLGELPDEMLILRYLLNRNRAKILPAFRSGDNQLPLGAWAYVLARADRTEYIDNENDDDIVFAGGNQSGEEGLPSAASASAIFELLRGPALFAQR